MKNFLSEMIDEEVDLKSLGIKGTDSKKNNRNVISVLRFERLLI